MSEQSPEPVYLYEGGPKAGGNLVIKLGYRGEAFSGFAEQPTQRTVAGELRRALETTLRRPCELTCAGRTDAGVHAIAQYVSVPVSEPRRPMRTVSPRCSRALGSPTMQASIVSPRSARKSCEP